MLTNLASTSAASVFAASPRPGVTGTLPVARGGTGVTTLAALKTALGISSSVLKIGFFRSYGMYHTHQTSKVTGTVDVDGTISAVCIISAMSDPPTTYENSYNTEYYVLCVDDSQQYKIIIPGETATLYTIFTEDDAGCGYCQASGSMPSSQSCGSVSVTSNTIKINAFSNLGNYGYIYVSGIYLYE